MTIFVPVIPLLSAYPKLIEDDVIQSRSIVFSDSDNDFDYDDGADNSIFDVEYDYS